MSRQLICWGMVVSSLAAGFAADTTAQTITYSDGGAYHITTQIFADVVLTNNTRMRVHPYGWIAGSALPPARAGARVLDASRLSMTGGHIWGTTGGASATGVLLEDLGHFEMLGGEVRGVTSGPGDAFGLQATENSAAVINTGNVVGATSGPGNAVALRAVANAALTVNGGELRAVTSEPGNATGILLEDHASLEWNGGMIYAITNGPQAFGIVANDLASVKITRGSLYAYGNSTNVDLVANDAARIAILGTSPYYPQGVPLAPLTGTISGKYANGTDFYFSFQRSPSATIILVPEPATGALLLWPIFGALLPRRGIGQSHRQSVRGNPTENRLPALARLHP